MDAPVCSRRRNAAWGFGWHRQNHNWFLEQRRCGSSVLPCRNCSTANEPGSVQQNNRAHGAQPCRARLDKPGRWSSQIADATCESDNFAGSEGVNSNANCRKPAWNRLEPQPPRSQWKKRCHECWLWVWYVCLDSGMLRVDQLIFQLWGILAGKFKSQPTDVGKI